MKALRELLILTTTAILCLHPLSAATAQDPATPPPTAKPAQPDPRAALAKIQRMLENEQFADAAPLAKALVDADPGLFDAWFALGYALHAQGKIDEALPAHLEAAKSPVRGTASVAHYNAGCAYALKGDKDKAIEQLTFAVDKKVNAQAGFETDPDLASLVSDPRFVALLEKRRGGGAAAKPDRAPEVQTIAYTSDRRGSRMVWFGAKGAAQMHLDWSTVAWRDAYAKAYDGGTFAGQRWRLGKDFWTTFDTNVQVSVGAVAIPAGAWFLTMTQRDGKVMLQFNDPAKLRAAKLDAFVADQLPAPAYEAAMELVRDDANSTKELTLELVPGATPMTATFDVKFGPFHLKAPIDARAE
ncbi:MAG: tetratricopeptide repeat protein [Planctomycetes bacterium]|nr:tetratricopeptide repeat protein [Planctomycetota bacterium]MCC7170470.1 tetratricopeptide repeat protein [Planctomycetota bacterium]